MRQWTTFTSNLAYASSRKRRKAGKNKRTRFDITEDYIEYKKKHLLHSATHLERYQNETTGQPHVRACRWIVQIPFQPSNYQTNADRMWRQQKNERNFLSFVAERWEMQKAKPDREDERRPLFSFWRIPYHTPHTVKIHTALWTMLRTLNTITRSRNTLGYVRSFSSTKAVKEDYDVVVVGKIV